MAATFAAAGTVQFRAAIGAQFARPACETFRRNSDAQFRSDAEFARVRCPACASSTARNSAENAAFRRSRGGAEAASSGTTGSRSRGSRVFSSRDEIPSEILEDSKFVPITSEDPRFGRSAILLLGFTNEEADKVQSLLKEMEGDFMEVLLCTQEMAKGTLGEAFDTEQPNLSEVKVAKGLPRISFLSGLTGEEIMMMIQIFPEAGLDPTVFAAHVPLNSDKSMQELMEEIMGDHRRLKQREPVEQES